MKNIYLFILVCISPFVLSAQYTAIPDANFEQALIDQGIDSEGNLDGQVLTSDVIIVTNLDISYSFGIFDLTGIEDFTNIEMLDCTNNGMNDLDISSNINLKVLKCDHNELTALDISNNLQLEELYCGNPAIDVGPFNFISNLDLSNNVNLKILECIDLWNLDELDLTQNVNLEILICSFTHITDLDLTQNINLRILNVDYCHLTHLNLVNNTALTNLVLTTDYPMIPNPNTNQIQSLDLRNNTALEILWVEDSIIEELNLKNATNSILLTVRAADNPNLVCIKVDDEEAANAGDYPYSQWAVDAHLFYSENCVLGTESIENMAIELFPNPITDFLFIENTTEKINKIEVLDVLGKRVLTKTTDLGQIDFSSLMSGFFFVKIYVNDVVLTKKVIKK